MKYYKYHSYAYIEADMYNILIKYIRMYLLNYDGKLDINIVILLLKFFVQESLQIFDISIYHLLDKPLIPSMDNGDYILSKSYETLMGLADTGVKYAMVMDDFDDIFDINFQTLNDKEILNLYRDFLLFIARVNNISFSIGIGMIEDSSSLSLKRVIINEGVNYWS